MPGASSSELRRFGLTVGGIFLLLGGLSRWRGHTWPPIVCTPQDAYLCFMRTNMDVLVLGNHILLKEEQPPLVEDFDWRERYALD